MAFIGSGRGSLSGRRVEGFRVLGLRLWAIRSYREVFSLVGSLFYIVERSRGREKEDRVGRVGGSVRRGRVCIIRRGW